MWDKKSIGTVRPGGEEERDRGREKGEDSEKKE